MNKSIVEDVLSELVNHVLGANQVSPMARVSTFQYVTHATNQIMKMAASDHTNDLPTDTGPVLAYDEDSSPYLASYSPLSGWSEWQTGQTIHKVIKWRNT